MSKATPAGTLLGDIGALRGLLDAVPNPIFIKDAKSRFVIVNKAMCELMGHGFEELIGRSDKDFVPAQQAAVFRAMDLRVLELGEPNENEELITNGAGELRTIVTRKAPLDLADGSRVIVACIADVTEFRRAEALVRHHAEHDHLTGLANRALFQRQLQQAIVTSRSDGVETSLLLIDLDGFKDVNDLNGHAVGDELLIEMARLLSALAAPDDVVARLGGDEFAIISRGEQPSSAAILADIVIDRLSRPMAIGGRQVDVTASVGVACTLGPAVTGAILLRQADLALYSAKRQGRNRWCLFEPGMEAVQIASRFLDEELRLAEGWRHFAICYQPILAMADLHVVGFEALLRWRHPIRGEIAPLQFMAAAERTGLVRALGEWALRQACLEAAGWPAQLRLAANISPRQFADPALPRLVDTILRETGIDPARIDLEITEAAVIKDIDDAADVSRRLRDLGIGLVLDDFGAGYSSLQILNALPFDKVKIDRSLIKDVGRVDRADAVLCAMLRLARALDLCVVAEGVETEEQIALLRREGCDEVQGFAFSEPKPITAFDVSAHQLTRRRA